MKRITNIEERVAKARAFHRSGYNCSQAVFMVYNDIHNIPKAQAMAVSAGIGGGVGGQREVCGTVAAMALLAASIVDKPYEVSDKADTYKRVQYLSEQFKTKNGSIICRVLKSPGADGKPACRKTCTDLVEDAVRIVAETINVIADE